MNCPHGAATASATARRLRMRRRIRRGRSLSPLRKRCGVPAAALGALCRARPCGGRLYRRILHHAHTSMYRREHRHIRQCPSEAPKDSHPTMMRRPHHVRTLSRQTRERSRWRPSNGRWPLRSERWTPHRVKWSMQWRRHAAHHSTSRTVVHSITAGRDSSQISVDNAVLRYKLILNYK